MAKKNQKHRQARKKAQAAKRAKRQKAKAAKRQKEQARAEARATLDPAAALLGLPAHWEPPPRHAVLHPAVLSPDGPQPLTLETTPGPGPSILAARFGERGVALYRRDENGLCVPTSPLDLPLDTEVSWAGNEPFEVLDAGTRRVCWEREPEWNDGALVGTLVVVDLVLDERGLQWAPFVPVVVRKNTRWQVEADEGLAEGTLDGRGIDWWSGSDGSHAQAVAEFLSGQAGALWAMVQQGPSPDPDSDQVEADPVKLVEAIKGPSPSYKRAAIDALVAHQDAVIPGLLAVLDEILASPPAPDDYEELGFEGIYTLVLLSYFRCTEAHDRIVALGRSLPTEVFETAFGGFLTEGFDEALLRTCGGDSTKIQALLLDRTADEYLRSQAAKALAGAVVLGYADRGEILELMANLLTPEAAEKGSYVWSGVGSAMLHLYPIEHQDRLVEACRRWLIEPMMFDAEHVVEEITRGPAQAVEGLRCVEQPGWHDIHAKLEWWACFRS